MLCTSQNFTPKKMQNCDINVNLRQNIVCLVDKFPQALNILHQRCEHWFSFNEHVVPSVTRQLEGNRTLSTKLFIQWTLLYYLRLCIACSSSECIFLCVWVNLKMRKYMKFLITRQSVDLQENMQIKSIYTCIHYLKYLKF